MEILKLNKCELSVVSFKLCNQLNLATTKMFQSKVFFDLIWLFLLWKFQINISEMRFNWLWDADVIWTEEEKTRFPIITSKTSSIDFVSSWSECEASQYGNSNSISCLENCSSQTWLGKLSFCELFFPYVTDKVIICRCRGTDVHLEEPIADSCRSFKYVFMILSVSCRTSALQVKELRGLENCWHFQTEKATKSEAAGAWNVQLNLKWQIVWKITKLTRKSLFFQIANATRAAQPLVCDTASDLKTFEVNFEAVNV